MFLLNTILASLALHRERRKCDEVGPSPCYSESKVVYAYQVLNTVAPRAFLAKIPFLAFLVTILTIFWIF